MDGPIEVATLRVCSPFGSTVCRSTPSAFPAAHNQLVAIGTLTGQMINLAGVPLGTIGATLLQIPVGLPALNKLLQLLG